MPCRAVVGALLGLMLGPTGCLFEAADHDRVKDAVEGSKCNRTKYLVKLVVVSDYGEDICARFNVRAEEKALVRRLTRICLR